MNDERGTMNDKTLGTGSSSFIVNGFDKNAENHPQHKSTSR
jgi:hypothetical protein